MQEPVSKIKDKEDQERVIFEKIKEKEQDQRHEDNMGESEGGPADESDQYEEINRYQDEDEGQAFYEPINRNNELVQKNRNIVTSQQVLAKVDSNIETVESASPDIGSSSSAVEHIDTANSAFDPNNPGDNPARFHPDFRSTKTNRTKIYLSIALGFAVVSAVVAGIIFRTKSDYSTDRNTMTTSNFHPAFSAEWTYWTLWGDCGIDSVQSRTRNCKKDGDTSNECPGSKRENRTCEIYDDCTALYKSGQRTSGVYTIQPQNVQALQVHCDLQQGGWIVIMRRYIGDQDFNGTWSTYKVGFGDLQKEFWLGNEKLYQLTNQASYKLMVDYAEWYIEKVYYVVYSTFRIDHEDNKYMLHVTGYSGNGTDLLGFSNGMNFSTIDQDNGRRPGDACASEIGGAGYWYLSCGDVIPTAPFSHTEPCMGWNFKCTMRLVWKIQPK